MKLLLAISIILFMAQPAYALQSHGPPEGLYVHQMGHAIFALALLYLFWYIRKSQDRSSVGWKYLQLFCCIMVGWNVLTFVGHLATEALSAEDLVLEGHLHLGLLYPLSVAKLIYYLAKMDHLLFTPGIAVLALALRAFTREEG